jgi:hypothetical protein
MSNQNTAPHHPFLSQAANDRLAWHWNAMNQAEQAADARHYTDEERNNHVAITTEAYTAAEEREYASLIVTRHTPWMIEGRICDILPALELQVSEWANRHPVGHKLALRAMEEQQQVLAEREARINALGYRNLAKPAIVFERETGDDGQWACWDEASPMFGIDW